VTETEVPPHIVERLRSESYRVMAPKKLAASLDGPPA